SFLCVIYYYSTVAQWYSYRLLSDLSYVPNLPVEPFFYVENILIYWPVGQAVKTPPFHGGNTGSSPVRVIFWRISSAGRASALQAEGRRFEPVILHHGGVAKWLNAADCKSAPSGSAVRICPPPPFLYHWAIAKR